MPQLFKSSGQTGSPDQASIDQKKKMAQMLQMMAMTPDPNATNNPAIVNVAAPLMKALGAWRMERGANKEQEALNASRMQDWENVTKAAQGTPEQVTKVPYVDDQAEFMGVKTPEGLGTMDKVIPAQPGSREQIVQAMMQARDPQLRMAGLQSIVGLNPGQQPSSVQEWNFYNNMKPADQARFLEMKRNPNIMNLGGEFAVRQPGGGVGERYKVTPKPEQMPEFQGAQVRAKETQKAAVGMEEDLAKKGIKAKNMNDLIEEARLNLKDASGGYAGTAYSAIKGAAGISDKTTQANQKLKLIGGWMVSNVPRMEGPQSDFDVKNYREMAATVGDTKIPIEDRMAALDALQKLQEKYSGVAPASNIDDLLKKY